MVFIVFFSNQPHNEPTVRSPTEGKRGPKNVGKVSGWFVVCFSLSVISFRLGNHNVAIKHEADIELFIESRLCQNAAARQALSWLAGFEAAEL